MVQRILYWWLDVSALRRWGVPLAILAAAAVIDIAFETTWNFGWGVGLVLIAWVAIFRNLRGGG